MTGLIELTGPNALSQEEARVLIAGEPYAAATERERETHRAAVEKIGAARRGQREATEDLARARALPMFGGRHLVVSFDPGVMELVYFQFLRGRPQSGLAFRPECAADLPQLERLIEHLERVRAQMAAGQVETEVAA